MHRITQPPASQISSTLSILCFDTPIPTIFHHPSINRSVADSIRYNFSSIVALHGLTGHAWNSFTTSSSVNQDAGRTKETNWLRDIMPRLLEENRQQSIYPRVMTFGYDADVWMTKSVAEIDGPVNTLLSYLDTERRDVGTQKYNFQDSIMILLGPRTSPVLRRPQSRRHCCQAGTFGLVNHPGRIKVAGHTCLRFSIGHRCPCQ